MDFLVVEGADALVAHIEGELGVEQFVADARGLCVLVDALACCLVELLAAGGKAEDVFLAAGGLANLQAAAVCLIGDAEHIDEFGLEG